MAIGLIVIAASLATWVWREHRNQRTRDALECIYLQHLVGLVLLYRLEHQRLPQTLADLGASGDLNLDMSKWEFDPSKNRIDFITGPKPGAFRIVMAGAKGPREAAEGVGCTPRA